VFLLDPYSIALSKLERGHAQDLEDVRALVSAGVLDPAELRRLLEAILPEYERTTIRADVPRFRRMLEAALASPA
jgi:hypothetical protein